PEFVRLAKRREDRAGAPAQDIRQIRRKVRAEHQHAVAGIQERLAEELLENLRSGPCDDILRLRRPAELAADERRRGLAELRDAGRRAIVGLVLLDRADAMGPRARRAIERAVADLELDDVLALRLQGLRNPQAGACRLDRQRASEPAEAYRHVVPL